MGTAGHRTRTVLVSATLAVATVVAVLGSAHPEGAAPAAAPSGVTRGAPALGTAPGAPWPTMRHDTRNTGASMLPGVDPGGSPWSFPTPEGIFSTPAVAADGVVYVGSADRNLYGLDAATGKERWRFQTGGIIDTAPALLAPAPRIGPSLVVGSGDEVLYRVRTDPAVPTSARVVWRFRPTLPPAEGQQLVNWWEGSPQVGPDGVIYDGNTGGGAYAVNPDGSQRWAVRTGNSVWTVPALADDGTTYWGSLDLAVRAVDSAGQELWRRTTLGFVTSSPALSRDGTLFVGSFDGRLYALDAASGAVRWTFTTGDHIYASPALVEGADGALRLIVIASTDGQLYGVHPDGTLAWAFDAGAPIRSSPAVGAAGRGGGGPVVYVGASNGRLYAVQADSGALRWAYDTTSTDPYLATRNQLNGSPALGPRGVYIGGQDGVVHHVPYDYCLRARADTRCRARELPPDDVATVYPVDVGGSTRFGGEPITLASTGVIVGRLVVRQGGSSVPASMVPVPDAATLVRVRREGASDDVEVDAQVSGDGRYLFVRPRRALDAATYRVTVGGVYSVGGARISNVEVGTANLTPFQGEFRVVATATGRRPWSDVAVPPPPPTSGGAAGAAGSVPAVSLSRLAVPLPPMLTSLNQIGFDFYDWIAGVVRSGPGDAVLWVVGATRDARGRPVVDPAAGFAFPLHGRLEGGTFSWSAPPGVALTFTFGPVPLQEFQLRGRFGPGGEVLPDAQFYAQAVCADVPGYGDLLPLTGMCNAVGILPSSGTYLGGVTRSAAAVAPTGLRVTSISRDGDEVVARFALAAGASFPASRHVASLLLLDRDGVPVPMDYRAATTTTTDPAGNVVEVRLRAPAATAGGVRAVALADVYPLAAAELAAG